MVPASVGDLEFNSRQLLDAEFTARESKDAGFILRQLEEAESNPRQLKDGRTTVDPNSTFDFEQFIRDGILPDHGQRS